MRSDRPRILFVSHSVDWTGPTKSLVLLLERLGGRFDVAVLASGDGELLRALEQRGIPVFLLPSLDKFSIPAMSRLIRSERFDLVYGNNTSGVSRNALLAAKIARVPFICHVRGMSQGRTWRGLFPLRFADATIAVSAAASRSIARYLGGRAPRVIYNGVSLDRAAVVDRAAARRHVQDAASLPPDAAAILSVAHVCPRKGQAHMVRAMAAVVEAVPRAHLLLLGALDRDPGYVSALQAQIERLGVGDHVWIAGFRSDVGRFLEGADLFMHAAEADPHPRAVLEAMAARLPVVAFAVDGVAETVEDGVSGRLVAAGDVSGLAEAAVELLQNERLCHDLGEAGRVRVEAEFSAERTAERVGHVIAEVLANRGRGRSMVSANAMASGEAPARVRR